MTKHFTAQHVVNGYAAMGGSLKRPRISRTLRTVAESIAANRRTAARMAAASKRSK